MIKDALSEANSRMSGAVRALEDDLGAIRTGRASPALAEKIMVDYYGTPTPLIQLATISAPEPRLLTIRPFDPASIKDIERGILSSDLGLTPNNDGKIIRLSIPALTEDRRHELVKLVKARMEEARVSVRNVRRDVHNDMREFEGEKLVSEDELHRGEEDLQKVTDEIIEQINAVGERKEREVLEV
ncbi:MAG: ribosome recycling factor [Chloroflexi bacterium]|nr:ribosome recycling factor [Chloroflexota bacterium]MDK1045904.1 ribosome recycling factor [Anaerolineales bacterium]MCH8093830.1 ribosome recycling factor [Chloroflexota bacterium]MCH8340494.1 ribosome recycling factor [Chloroflexota bacterium]MCH8877229.1 ribosome recycling factor [Chloroflexota bacterium]